MSKAKKKIVKPNLTSVTIAAMLVEKVGRSFLDSGGTPKYDANGKYIGSDHGYGRAYERNTGRDFDAELRVFSGLTTAGSMSRSTCTTGCSNA